MESTYSWDYYRLKDSWDYSCHRRIGKAKWRLKQELPMFKKAILSETFILSLEIKKRVVMYYVRSVDYGAERERGIE